MPIDCVKAADYYHSRRNDLKHRKKSTRNDFSPKQFDRACKLLKEPELTAKEKLVVTRAFSTDLPRKKATKHERRAGVKIAKKNRKDRKKKIQKDHQKEKDDKYHNSVHECSCLENIEKVIEMKKICETCRDFHIGYYDDEKCPVCHGIVFIDLGCDHEPADFRYDNFGFPESDDDDYDVLLNIIYENGVLIDIYGNPRKISHEHECPNCGEFVYDCRCSEPCQSESDDFEIASDYEPYKCSDCGFYQCRCVSSNCDEFDTNNDSSDSEFCLHYYDDDSYTHNIFEAMYSKA